MIRALVFLASLASALISAGCAARELPRILVRDGGFATADGMPFVPLGVNWVIVSPGDIHTSQNISFNPDYYRPHREEIRETLRRIAGAGFNFVRIRIDAVAFDQPGYLDDVIDFVGFAAELGLYSEPTGQWLPSSYYGLISHEGWREPDRGGTSGRFVAEWGQSADLADPASRQALADEATLRWIDGVIAEARKVAPSVLFTTSVFTPEDVFRAGCDGVRMRDAKWGDPRQPFRLAVIARSDADFLQLHLYPHALPVSIAAGLASVEFDRLLRGKPVLLGETGAYEAEFPASEQAAQAVTATAREACAHGSAGWAYWTWNADEQRDLWNLAEQDGFLARRLSPKTFDWCEKL